MAKVVSTRKNGESRGVVVSLVNLHHGQGRDPREPRSNTSMMFLILKGSTGGRGARQWHVVLGEPASIV